MVSTRLMRWEAESRTWWEHWRERIRAALRRPATAAVTLVTGLTLGAGLGAGPPADTGNAALHARLERAQSALQSTRAELELVRLELARLNKITRYSSRYDIPADLSAAIYDIALAEGIDPSLGYRLVWAESRFYRRAISSAGAVGLAQLMPATAFGLDPSLEYSDLFDRETNLHLGFEYLRLMLEKYNGDLRLALLAYNRGPGTVDRVLRRGGDPSNGYARLVMRGP